MTFTAWQVFKSGKHGRKRGFSRFRKAWPKERWIEPISTEIDAGDVALESNPLPMRNYSKAAPVLLFRVKLCATTQRGNALSLSVAEFCAQGAPWNWFKWLMNELFQACYAQLLKGGGYFIFGYLLVAFAMWKWQAPVGRKLSVASGGRLAMRFEPWKSRADSSNISFNNAAFEQWYNDLINATHRRIPRPLKACPKALLRRL